MIIISLIFRFRFIPLPLGAWIGSPELAFGTSRHVFLSRGSSNYHHFHSFLGLWMAQSTFFPSINSCIPSHGSLSWIPILTTYKAIPYWTTLWFVHMLLPPPLFLNHGLTIQPITLWGTSNNISGFVPLLNKLWILSKGVNWGDSWGSFQVL